MSGRGRAGAAVVVAVLAAVAAAGVWLHRASAPPPTTPDDRPDYLRATYSPLHFRPAIESAQDDQCLSCHKEVLEDRVRERSPSGRSPEAALADYQKLSTYRGDQETFHRRHLVTSLSRRLMNLRCNTCHLGHDPRDEAQGSSATQPPEDAAYTLRKQVNVETVCLKCHGQMNWRLMRLPAPWPKARAEKPNGCFECHDKTRTVRHQVPYLDADAIEIAGRENSDACYGCHGGRAWYRISYAYTRHAWPDMPERIPEWAKDRRTE